MVLRRPCKICSRTFLPTGKYTKHCKSCLRKELKSRWTRKKLRDRVPGEELALNIKHQLKDETKMYSVGYMFEEHLAIGIVMIPKKQLDELGIKGIVNCGDEHHHTKLRSKNGS